MSGRVILALTAAAALVFGYEHHAHKNDYNQHKVLFTEAAQKGIKQVQDSHGARFEVMALKNSDGSTTIDAYRAVKVTPSGKIASINPNPVFEINTYKK